MGRKRRRRNPLSVSVIRVRVFLLAVAILFSFAGLRSVQLQVLDAPAYAKEASEEMRRTNTLKPSRGQIVDRDGVVLASTEATVSVVGDPLAISTNGKEPKAMREEDHQRAEEAPKAIAKIVAGHTGGDRKEMVRLLSKTESRWAPLAERISLSTWLAIKGELAADGWIGVTAKSDPKRTYPLGTVASNLVGFMIKTEDDGFEGGGGLEYAFQEELSGTEGSEAYDLSPYGRIPLSNQVLEPAVDGADIQLTIDSDFQWMVEKILGKQCKAVSCKWGSTVVLDVQTGEILAMANYPSFNSNDLGKTQAEDLGNRAVGASYEPGSVQKLLTLAAVLDSELITPDTDVPISSEIQVGDHYVKDAFDHDDITLTARGVIVRSSNIGAIVLARMMESETMLEYMKGFGLGSKPGSGLPGEESGNIPNANMPDYQRDSMAFGYGISVTPLQMAAAVAAMANGGVYNQPTVVKSITDGNETVRLPERESHRVISETAAAEVLDMMNQMVIFNQQRLGVEGFNTGAKTGTARLAGSSGYRGQVASIVGVGPTEDPRVVVLVVMERPDQMGSGLGSAGPAYRDTMRLALPRFGALPSEEVATTQLPIQR